MIRSIENVRQARAIFPGLLFLIAVFLTPGTAGATSISELEGITAITVTERTTSNPASGFFVYNFGITDPALFTRLASLSPTSNDFEGVVGREHYDVFISDENGNLNAAGEYLTIEARYDFGLPAGGGLNISEVALLFDDGSTEGGDSIASFNALGNNYIPGSELRAVDGNILTHTTIGSTFGINTFDPTVLSNDNNRLRITIGFDITADPMTPGGGGGGGGGEPVPEPTSLVLLGAALLGFRRAI